MINFYNRQLIAFEDEHPAAGTKATRSGLASVFVDRNPREYSWDRSDFGSIASGIRYGFRDDVVRRALYRPFLPQHVAFDRSLNNETYRLPQLFAGLEATNRTVIVQQMGPSPFFVLSADAISDDKVCGAGNATYVFARWRYANVSDAETLFTDKPVGQISNLNPAGIARFRQVFGPDITDDDVFAYVYGVLHSSDFRSTFETNLRKEGPRVPLVRSRSDFDAFAAAGQELLDLRVGYETIEPYPLIEEWADGAKPDTDQSLLLVGMRRMTYPTVADPETGKKVPDRTRVIYNPHLTLSGIPLMAHDYVLGTRSGIDWIIDRYYVRTDKASGIVNDPNEWGLERGEPRYIIDLIKRVVTVSLRTVDIVNTLPPLTF